MMSQKQLADSKDQIKREILDLDHQIHELETFYMEDTKEAGNLLKGFETYTSIKTSKIQSGQKKQKVENYERLFSLSSATSKTSQIMEDSLSDNPMTKAEFILASKRRFRGGKPKSGGKTVRDEPQEDDDAESGEVEDGEDSLDDSVSKNRGGSKKKKVHKMPARKS